MKKNLYVIFLSVSMVIILLSSCAEQQQIKQDSTPNAFQSNDPEYLYKLCESYLAEDKKTESMYCCRKASGLGHIGAMGIYGTMLLASKLPANYPEAHKLLSKAAEHGDVNGMRNLGMIYLNGYGVSEDLNEAKKWLKMAAEKGDDGAKKQLVAMNETIRINPNYSSAKVRYDGIYQGPKEDRTYEYLKFCEDGTVLSINLQGDEYVAIQMLGMKGIPGTGTYLIRNAALTFSIATVGLVVDYEGMIRDDTLILSTYNRRSGHKDLEKVYQFVKTNQIAKSLDAEEYHKRGFTYSNAGNIGMAMENYDKAISINPNYAQAYNSRGSAYLLKGNYDRADQDFKKGCELGDKESCNKHVCLLGYVPYSQCYAAGNRGGDVRECTAMGERIKKALSADSTKGDVAEAFGKLCEFGCKDRIDGKGLPSCEEYCTKTNK